MLVSRCAGDAGALTERWNYGSRNQSLLWGESYFGLRGTSFGETRCGSSILLLFCDDGDGVGLNSQLEGVGSDRDPGPVVGLAQSGLLQSV